MRHNADVSFKPGDFFVSVLGFFAIIVPGAILTLLWTDRFLALFRSKGLAVHAVGGGSEGWLAFLLVSYLVGQSLYAAGSWTLDAVYSRSYALYKPWKKSIEGDPLLKPLIKACMAEKGQAGVTGTYPWARAYISSRNTGAANAVERLDADSKFFRSITLVLAVAPYLLVPANFRWDSTIVAAVIGGAVGIVAYVGTLYLSRSSGRDLFTWLGVIPAGLIFVAASGASTIVSSWFSLAGLAVYVLILSGCFLRFANQRWERDDTAYEFVLTMP